MSLITVFYIHDYISNITTYCWDFMSEYTIAVQRQQRRYNVNTQSCHNMKIFHITSTYTTLIILYNMSENITSFRYIQQISKKVWNQVRDDSMKHKTPLYISFHIIHVQMKDKAFYTKLFHIIPAFCSSVIHTFPNFFTLVYITLSSSHTFELKFTVSYSRLPQLMYLLPLLYRDYIDP